MEIYMKVTIKQIAELAGVSRGTVDRVLNNRKGVKPDVRNKILNIAAELKYEPNIAAKALAYNNKPVKFGIIMPPREITFFNEIRNGINSAENELKDFGISLEYRYVSNQEASQGTSAIEEFINFGFSGIMFSGMDDPRIRNQIDKAVDKGIPVITFNSDVTMCKRLCFIGQDLYKSGRIAAGLMYRVAGRNSKIVAVTGNLEFQAHKARIDGFTDRAAESSRNMLVTKVIEGFDRYEDTYTQLSDFLSSNPETNGIYMATGDISACVDVVKNLALEQNIHIICNDILPVVLENMKSQIIDFTIVQNPFMQGYKSLKILYEYVFTGKNPDSEFIYTDTDIIIPESLY
jgi:LacI family transcriptional regulator